MNNSNINSNNMFNNFCNNSCNNGKTLYHKLVDNSVSEIYPFHMPGHKRNTQLMDMVNPYSVDITEIDDFDNLHKPEGIILDIEKRISDYYHTDSSHILVNGTTCGILSAISGVTEVGDNIVVARNSHKSVYNGIYLRGLKASYIMPKVDKYGICEGINPKQVEDAMMTSNSRVVVITSPTYEGIISDIKSIAEVVHRLDGVLIVDEAHGAHLGFHKYFPDSAYSCGADIVVQSIHKTLPAMTQTAIMHINHKRVSVDKIKKFLSIYQSSSPSYVLMASVDRCFSLLESEGAWLYDSYVDLLESTRSGLRELKHMKLYMPSKDKAYAYDKGKLVIIIEDMDVSGKKLHDILLYNYKLQMEMCQSNYVIAMTSMCDTKEGMLRLENALVDIDKNWDSIFELQEEGIKSHREFVLPEVVLSVSDIDGKDTTMVELSNSDGEIASEYIYVYPPGVPIIVPGERISVEIIGLIKNCIQDGLNVIGLSEDKERISVLKTD